MLKILVIICFSLFSSTFLIGQTKSIEVISQQIKSLKAEKSIQIEYDKSSNYSKLLLLSDGFGAEQNKKNGLSIFTFGMMYGFNGRELTFAPDVFILTFWAKGKNTRFAESHFWKANVDGENIEIGEARYVKKNGDDREFLNFAILREKLEIVARGKNVVFNIGNAEFIVTSEQLQVFAKLLIISNPAE